MVSYGIMRKTQDQRWEFHLWGGLQSMRMTAESESLAQILAYSAENKRKSIMERERLQDFACEAEGLESDRPDQTTTSESRRLDCIYDNEPLGFEKNPLNESQKMQAQDPLEVINLGDGITKRPTYISTKVGSEMRTKLVKVLNEYRD